jgi:MFS family permease
MVHGTGGPTQAGPARSNYAVVRLFAALAFMTVAGAAMWGTVVALKPVALEFGLSRGHASLPYTLFMVGFGLGGVVMGRLSDRFGVRWLSLTTSATLPAGLFLAAQASAPWHYWIAVGLFCAFLGAATTFGPLASDISHWFTRRRGLAVGIIFSGTYLAGAIWPPVWQVLIDADGWRSAFESFAFFTALVMLPLALVLWPKPPHLAALRGAPPTAAAGKPLGFSPLGLQCLICCAGVGCCAAMAMPQVHMVAYATDLGFAAQRGAEMLSLMLGFGVVSRLVSGWLSDRIGAIATLILGSALQLFALVAYLTADTLVALYVLAVVFGLSQGGIVPSYAVIIRTFFAPGESGWRIGAALLFTMMGMALGGWMAGALYDLTGSYTVSFLNAIAFNVLNLGVAATLYRRSLALRLAPATADPA